VYEPTNATRHHLRLSRAGSSDNEQSARGRENGLFLFAVQTVEQQLNNRIGNRARHRILRDRAGILQTTAQSTFEPTLGNPAILFKNSGWPILTWSVDQRNEKPELALGGSRRLGWLYSPLLSFVVTKLFNPRRHKWERHFRWNDPFLEGRTAVGRTTIAVLAMNAPEVIAA
jgi:hypothetical protein